jgi:hypothetical protein
MPSSKENASLNLIPKFLCKDIRNRAAKIMLAKNEVEPTTGVDEDAGKKEPSYTVGRNVN